MTEDDRLKKIAREAAQEAVNETLHRLGIDDEDWKETQQDLAYLRRFRNGSERIGQWVTKSTVMVLVSAIAWAIWEALKGGK